ncbi:hypothetical protein BDQ17DRAFT_1368799 [Cyathus striatus]|nr:hypothetical protein BDQ17DRAFT_1368799 [Cyathus striatus]
MVSHILDKCVAHFLVFFWQWWFSFFSFFLPVIRSFSLVHLLVYFFPPLPSIAFTTLLSSSLSTFTSSASSSSRPSSHPRPRPSPCSAFPLTSLTFPPRYSLRLPVLFSSTFFVP